MNKQNDKGIAPTTQGVKLAIPGVDGANVRVTPDGRVSVYDFLKAACGLNNPRQLWGGDKKKRKGGQRGLVDRHPELVQHLDEFKFPGKGQRKTPVMNRAGVIELMQVLPGEVGAKFRRQTAQLIIRYLDGDVSLADEVMDRAAAKGKHEDIERHIARSKGIIARKQFTSACKRHGVYGPGYSQVTNAIYHGCFNKNAKELRKERGLKPKQNFREFGANTSELIAFSAIEIAASNGMDSHDAYGNDQCAQVTYKAAKAIAKIMKGEF